MEALHSLYREDLILFSDAKTQEDVFREVGTFLHEKDLVKSSFIDGIIERESHYPTGLDLSPVADQMPNVAIPHTETEYCNDKAVVFIKLKHPLPFNNMISPEDTLDVSYLFLILNNDKEAQTNVLSELMGFLTNEENVRTLETLESEQEIFQFLNTK